MKLFQVYWGYYFHFLLIGSGLEPSSGTFDFSSEAEVAGCQCEKGEKGDPGPPGEKVSDKVFNRITILTFYRENVSTLKTNLLSREYLSSPCHSSLRRPPPKTAIATLLKN